MVIRLNNETLDVTLEQEKVLSDIIDELFRLINEAGFRISKIEHNGVELCQDERSSWAHLSVDKIGTIDISAQTMREALFEHLTTIRQFLSMVCMAFEKENGTLLRDMASDYPPVRNSIDSFVSNTVKVADGDTETGRSLAIFLDEQIQTFGVFSTSPRFEEHEAFSSRINSLITLISERMREVSAPAEELKKTAETLKAGLSGISDVSVLLQTGKDREAMGSVLTFIELVSKIIRLYPLILDESGSTLDELSLGDGSFKDFYLDFNGILKELIEAFTAKDSVLIGDLLEYEVVPRLETLLPTLEQLACREETK